MSEDSFSIEHDVDRSGLAGHRALAQSAAVSTLKSSTFVKEGSGPPNRDGLPRLPVGQHEVKNWPVLDLGEQPDVSPGAWNLDIGGLIENPTTLTWNQFMALPQVDDVSDFHCVTTWSRYNNHWRGVRFRTIAEIAVPTGLLKVCEHPGKKLPQSVCPPPAPGGRRGPSGRERSASDPRIGRRGCRTA